MHANNIKTSIQLEFVAYLSMHLENMRLKEIYGEI